jgi:hypothetical protein
MGVELTALHWLYVVFLLLIIGTFLLRKDTTLVLLNDNIGQEGFHHVCVNPLNEGFLFLLHLNFTLLPQGIQQQNYTPCDFLY